MCQCILFDVGGVEIHSIECIEYCTKDQSNVEDVEDRSNTPKGCNAMYVGDVEDGKRIYTHTFWLITSLILNGFSIRKSFGKLRLRAFQPYHQILCMSTHVEDVEDRSNTPKGCNAMLCMSKMSKMHSIECIEYCTKDQSNVEDVEDRSNTPKGCNAMLCMSKMSKMHSIECIEYCTKDQSNVEDVEDRSNTPKGCNAMYVEDVEDAYKCVRITM